MVFRLDLLPFYARLVATLHPCMSDVAEDLCSMLKGDFRFHVSQTHTQTNRKNACYVSRCDECVCASYRSERKIKSTSRPRIRR